jgi:multiple sugar transport system permease protein
MTVPKSKKTSRVKLSTILIYAFCVVMAILFLAPIVATVLGSLKTPSEAAAVPPTYFPSKLSFENYLALSQYGAGLWRYISNSFVAALITVIGALVLSLLGGFGFARFSFPGKGILFIIILSTLMIPFQSILTPLFIILATLKLQNTVLGLALVYIVFQLPFGLFLMRNSFAVIPREIEESALLDGCTPLTMLFRVMLPLVAPGLVTVAIYAFINAWNEFLAALIFMNQESNFTLPVMLVTVQSGLYGQIDWGALQAGVTIAMIPCIALFLVLQRYYIEGLMGGAVKG